MSASADLASGDGGRIHSSPIEISGKKTKKSALAVDATILNSIERRTSRDIDHLESTKNVDLFDPSDMAVESVKKSP